MSRFTFNWLNALMKQPMCTSLDQVPAAIDKIEQDFQSFNDRAVETFPAFLRMPLLLQMIPKSQRESLDIQFCFGGAKTYNELSKQLLDQGHRATYKRCRRDDTSALGREGQDDKSNNGVDERKYTPEEMGSYWVQDSVD